MEDEEIEDGEERKREGELDGGRKTRARADRCIEAPSSQALPELSPVHPCFGPVYAACSAASLREKYVACAVAHRPPGRAQRASQRAVQLE